ncbi:DUF6150 family protein [Hymenobacter jejuensis]|uniref:DUF6150 family protein n=1 Tax=Hymenobacter jejuensis TaxID=2502781 RepID=UPI001E431A78|nr:DUF6150 family protein [Hymenobacter jejuensis]
MFFSLIFSGLLWLSAFTTPSLPATTVAAASAVRSVDPCLIYGSIYLERDPRRRSYCFAAAYEEPDEAFADLMVFKEENKLFADRAGYWYITTSRDFADYVVFVSDKRALADFAIHYTTARSFAGCRKQ